MLAIQTDPIGILSLSQQRHAALIADVRHDQLVQAALRSYAAHAVRPENVSQGRFGRIAGPVSARLQQSLGLAPFASAPVHGG